jgi:hypothetical protein
MDSIRRLVALLLLVCMPVQAVAALDDVLCAQIGAGDAGLAQVTGRTSDVHESLDLGGVRFDACGLCHLGGVPVSIATAWTADRAWAHVLVAADAPVWIEYRPAAPHPPPRPTPV